MENNLFDKVKFSLSKKTTEELLTIWKENDDEQWSPDAFKAINQILLERKVIIPEQKPSISSFQNTEKPQNGKFDAREKKVGNKRIESFIIKIISYLSGVVLGRFVFVSIFLSFLKWIDEQCSREISKFFSKLFLRFNIKGMKEIGLYLDNEPLSFIAIILSILICSWIIMGGLETISSIISDKKEYRRVLHKTEALKKYWEKKKNVRLERFLKKKNISEKEKTIIKEILDKRKDQDKIIDTYFLNKSDSDIIKKNLNAALIFTFVGGILMILGLLLPWVSGIFSFSGMFPEFPSRHLIYPAILISILGFLGLIEESRTYKTKTILHWIARICAGIFFLYQIYLYIFFSLKLHQTEPIKKSLAFFYPSLGAGFWICSIGIILVLLSTIFVERMPLE